jgi:hypothetical protein
VENDVELYWERVRERANDLESDGCSGVPDFHLDCCLEHDIAYRTGATVDGAPMTRAAADARLRRCIQSRSAAGVLSPMSWWRWLAVRLFASRSFKARP